MMCHAKEMFPSHRFVLLRDLLLLLPPPPYGLVLPLGLEEVAHVEVEDAEELVRGGRGGVLAEQTANAVVLGENTVRIV